MGIERRWHEDAPERDGQPTVGDVFLSRMQATECIDHSALNQEPQSDAIERPEASSDSFSGESEILATVHRAIQSTEIARQMNAEPARAQVKPATVQEEPTPASVTRSVAHHRPTQRARFSPKRFSETSGPCQAVGREKSPPRRGRRNHETHYIPSVEASCAA